MKTIKEQIEVMTAYMNGADIEYRCADDWEYIANPTWNWRDFCFRVRETVKPLFPTKEQGAKYFIYDDEICSIPDWYIGAARQGRTFYTLEDAEAFVKREQAKIYCLEAINRVNKGDNGFKAGKHNYHIYYNPHMNAIGVDSSATYLSLELNEYIRTEEAAKKLINDPEFVEDWKIWKGVI